MAAIQPGASRTRITQGLARRLARGLPSFSAGKLADPVFVVGFNNCGKSRLVKRLAQESGLLVYPDEGNGELWFPGYYPWISSDVPVGPIWSNPDAFLQSVLASRRDGFLQARAQLGAYQWLNGGRRLVHDSGMLAALAPELLERFPDARFVHVVRDGRLSSYLTARLEWSRMLRAPGKYLAQGCPLDFRSVLERMAGYWAWTIGRMDVVGRRLPGKVLELRYEDWWHQPEGAVSQVCEFLEVPLQGAVQPAARLEDLSPLLRAEMTREELEMVEGVIGPALAAKGYAGQRGEPVAASRAPGGAAGSPA